MGEGASVDAVALPTSAAFRSAVGSAFAMGGKLDATVLTLMDVTSLDRRAGSGSFSVLFGGSAPVLPQGTYPVEHEALGTFDLFLVPVVTEDGQRYEAIFNRPAP